MTQTASSYTDTLRFHVVPRRLSVTELRRLPEGYGLPTLLSKRRLEVTRSPAYAFGISVGGVEIAFPGLFYGRYVAVHGLSGILSLRSNAVSGVSSVPPSPPPVVPPSLERGPVGVPPVASAGRRWRNNPNRPDKRTFLAPNSPPARPVPKGISFNVTDQRRHHPPVEVPAPAPNAVSRRAPPPTSPVMGRINAPLPGPAADSPTSLDIAPVMTPVAATPIYPPEGFSDAPIEEKPSVSVTESWGGELEGVVEMPKNTLLDENITRNCDLEGSGPMDNADQPRIMQCYAS